MVFRAFEYPLVNWREFSLQLWNATSARINLEPSCVPVCFFVLKFSSVSMFGLPFSTFGDKPQMEGFPTERSVLMIFLGNGR